MQSLARQIVQAHAERALSGSALGHFRPVGARSALSSAGSLIKRWNSSKPSRHGGVAMEVVIEGNDVRLKRLSDMVCKRYGMRCVVSLFSVWCNVNDTVEDALKIINTNIRTTDVMRAMWGEKKLAPSDIITANAKFVYMDGAQINIVVDVVRPKHEVITLSSDTKLWQAKEMMKEKRLRCRRKPTKHSTFSGNLLSLFGAPALEEIAATSTIPRAVSRLRRTGFG